MQQVIDNDIWNNRAQRFQLEGGAHGGMHKIDRIPQDVVAFLEIAKKIDEVLSDINCKNNADSINVFEKMPQATNPPASLKEKISL